MKFEELVNEITLRGLNWHRERLIENTERNAQHIKRGIAEIEGSAKPVLVVSAGPSLYKRQILKRLNGNFCGTIIATDGSYVQCLKAGIVPDYVITLDPHPTRMVRWFGDPELGANVQNDDYFERQDLDVEFRKNAESENQRNIALVNSSAYKTRFIVATTSPANVVVRLLNAGVEPYWFVPLVDNPNRIADCGHDTVIPLTRQMAAIAKVPAMNTGGTVGTAAWAFSHCILRAPNIAVAGMDFGYSMETPFAQTQSWNMLKDEPNVAEFYPRFTHPVYGEAYTDPTYFWYRDNFLDLLKANAARVINCSGAGLLFGNGVGCMELEQWLAFSS